MKKRVLAVLLAISVAAGICDIPVFAMAQQESCEEETRATGDMQQIELQQPETGSQDEDAAGQLQIQEADEAEKQKFGDAVQFKQIKDTEVTEILEPGQTGEVVAGTTGIEQDSRGAGIDTATEITLGNEKLSGKVTGEAEIQTYKFTIAQSGRATWDIFSYVNFAIEIVNADGKTVWVDKGTCKSGVNYCKEKFVTDLTKGTYYLRFIGTNVDLSGTNVESSTDGTWEITTAFTGANETYSEPNNDNSKAITLPFNKNIKGQIAVNDEKDIYKVTLNSSGRIAINMTSYMKYYAIDLTDASGNRVWKSDDNEWNENAGKRDDTHQVDLLAGTYYMEISGKKAVESLLSIGENITATGNYEFTVAYTSAGETYPEPNDSKEQAAKLSFNKNVKGQIAANDSKDTYQLKLKSAGRITINLTSFMKYYAIDLTDASGNRVWKSDYNEWNENAGRRGDTHQIDLLAGTYYMEISGKKAVESSLSIGENITATGNYEFKVTFSDAKVNHKEPNNDFATACNINSGSTVRGQIAQNDSCDIFKFELTNKQEIKVNITSYMRFYCLYVYDINGNQRWCKEKDNEWNVSTGYRKDTHKITLEKGTYYLKVTGNQFGSHNPYTGTYTLKATYKSSIKNATVSKIGNQAYSGKAKKPKVTVKYNGKKLEAGKDYQISYSNNKKIGTAQVTIKGKGNYNGTKKVTFKIVPKKTTITGAKNSKKKAAVITWKKDKNVTGYEVYRSTSKNKGYKKVKTIKKNKTTSFTNSKLKKGKTYYYKVRSYKTVNKKNYYGSYSKVKAVKIKK